MWIRFSNIFQQAYLELTLELNCPELQMKALNSQLCLNQEGIDTSQYDLILFALIL